MPAECIPQTIPATYCLQSLGYSRHSRGPPLQSPVFLICREVPVVLQILYLVIELLKPVGKTAFSDIGAYCAA